MSPCSRGDRVFHECAKQRLGFRRRRQQRGKLRRSSFLIPGHAVCPLTRLCKSLLSCFRLCGRQLAEQFTANLGLKFYPLLRWGDRLRLRFTLRLCEFDSALERQWPRDRLLNSVHLLSV